MEKKPRKTIARFEKAEDRQNREVYLFPTIDGADLCKPHTRIGLQVCEEVCTRMSSDPVHVWFADQCEKIANRKVTHVPQRAQFMSLYTILVQSMSAKTGMIVDNMLVRDL